MNAYKLTTANYIAAGKEIMADARCTTEVKAAVRKGTSGEADSNGLRTYIASDKNDWFDQIFAKHAAK